MPSQNSLRPLALISFPRPSLSAQHARRHAVGRYAFRQASLAEAGHTAISALCYIIAISHTIIFTSLERFASYGEYYQFRFPATLITADLRFLRDAYAHHLRRITILDFHAISHAQQRRVTAQYQPRAPSMLRATIFRHDISSANYFRPRPRGRRQPF